MFISSSVNAINGALVQSARQINVNLSIGLWKKNQKALGIRQGKDYLLQHLDQGENSP